MIFLICGLRESTRVTNLFPDVGLPSVFSGPVGASWSHWRTCFLINCYFFATMMAAISGKLSGVALLGSKIRRERPAGPSQWQRGPGPRWREMHQIRTMKLCFGLVLLLVAAPALARDNGQWNNVATDAQVRQWYRSLMMPDYPSSSCCGEADAYYADSFEIDGDRYVAIITDERPDAPLRRPHVVPGTRIVVPNNKLKYDQGNPTGHGVIFLGSYNGTPHVYCYVAPGGV